MRRYGGFPRWILDSGEIDDDGKYRALSVGAAIDLVLGCGARAGWDCCRGVASAGRHARQALEQEADEGGGRAGGGQVDRNPGFQLDHSGGDFDQPEA